MLKGLKKEWGANPEVSTRLIEELDLTIKYLERKTKKGLSWWTSRTD
jgi:hypothetical protein